MSALHRNGRELPVELTIAPIRLGQTYLFSAFLHDISERKRLEEVRDRAEETLRISEERFRDLFEEAPVAYHEVDCEGIIRRVNQAECTLLGYEAE